MDMRDLNSEESDILFKFTCDCIIAAVNGTQCPDPPSQHPRLSRPQATFVTIHHNTRLRGCIGKIVGDIPLIHAVAAMSEAAALHDSRFEAVTSPELAHLHIDISLLSPLQRIVSFNEIVIGTHGLLVAGRGARGILLPQIPIEQGWNRETFLAHTCTKAGLSQHAWRDNDITFDIFTTQLLGGQLLSPP